jgi:hypothetical protein
MQRIYSFLTLLARSYSCQESAQIPSPMHAGAEASASCRVFLSAVPTTAKQILSLGHAADMLKARVYLRFHDYGPDSRRTVAVFFGNGNYRLVIRTDRDYWDGRYIEVENTSFLQMLGRKHAKTHQSFS